MMKLQKMGRVTRCSTKLADRGEDQYGLDIDQNDQIHPLIFAWQNGYEADLNNKDLNFDSPEFIGAMELYLAFSKTVTVKQNKD